MLIDYCRLSAMPVGRYRARRPWRGPARHGPPSDALCAALQVINHLQDCGKDYRELDRVYLPADVLAAHGADVSRAWRRPRQPGLARGPRSAGPADARAAATERAGFARDDPRPPARRRSGGDPARWRVSLVSACRRRDPLSERVHHPRPRPRCSPARAALPRAVAPPMSTPSDGAGTAALRQQVVRQLVLRRDARAAARPARGDVRDLWLLPEVDDIADDWQGARAERAAALDGWRRRHRRALCRRRHRAGRALLRRAGRAVSRCGATISTR